MAVDAQPGIVRLIRQDAPGWRPADGACPTCIGQYAMRLAARRSPTSLHTATEPHTTFPYYHLDEETALSQPQRLPDYAPITGAGVTIAFLDSGYYPHPDLAQDGVWPSDPPLWAKLGADALRRQLECAPLRLVEYVDLTDGGEEIGLHLPSLWDGAGASWHGQMTTTLAAGNGLLSGGLFRGYAPQAQLLPIKIGASNGRIPEAAILAGLRWLLRDDNWLRYNVRVVNIAVGGDYDEPWYNNLVCLAAEELSNRGVLLCAAAGNSGRRLLYAPAQAPSVLTVGGYEDANRRWSPTRPEEVAALALYHHNSGRVLAHGRWAQKPELLALGRWLPAPILPPSAVFAEVYAIGELRRVLFENRPGAAGRPAEDGLLDEWMFDVWEVVRKRMNAHKWVHPYYQHVDGTSVAVAQVSATAAQMFAANPSLTGAEVKALLLGAALPLPHHPHEQTGSGLLQPAMAVAAALRAGNGPLAGRPYSSAQPTPGELQKWVRQGRVTASEMGDPTGNGETQPVYFGHYAPDAAGVSVVGSWNGWQPGVHRLRPAGHGWHHGLFFLPPGRHAYRFWLTDSAAQRPLWRPDPENPMRLEGGYGEDHSLVEVS
ncbi:MAG: S8 family serine peptidase [Caldilineaceae bacterium]|nr:S8 family serine peptidase [Caldilineaceae bacterium]